MEPWAAFLASSNAVPLPRSLIADHLIVWHPWRHGCWSTMSGKVCNWCAVECLRCRFSLPPSPPGSLRMNQPLTHRGDSSPISTVRGSSLPGTCSGTPGWQPRRTGSYQNLANLCPGSIAQLAMWPRLTLRIACALISQILLRMLLTSVVRFLSN